MAIQSDPIALCREFSLAALTLWLLGAAQPAH
jgi:hypothetical protein